jgi:hypothetical protein
MLFIARSDCRGTGNSLQTTAGYRYAVRKEDSQEAQCGSAASHTKKRAKKSAGLPRLGNSLTDTGSVLQVEETTTRM